MGDKDILVYVHDSYRWVVAICDRELVGRKLVEEPRALDLSGNFFRGLEMDEEEVAEEISRCVDEDATFNIVGQRSIEIALKTGLITREGVMNIEGIPFALVLL